MDLGTGVQPHLVGHPEAVISADEFRQYRSIVCHQSLRRRAVQIKEGLALLRLQGLPLVLPAKLGDGLAFNPFSLQQDCLSVQSRRRRELPA